MKILYGIQGTGNGHLTRAMEIVPELKQKAEVDVLISGLHSELELPFDVRYRLNGLGFVFGKKGGIDLLKTYRKNNLKLFYKEVKDLVLDEYDLIISDFEPITAWAAIRQNKLSIGLSNQASLLSSDVPKPDSKDFVGRFIIRNYAPASFYFGFSYEKYGSRIYTPVIRKSLRETAVSDLGHFTVYLPSYADERIAECLCQIDSAKFHVFSKSAKTAYVADNVEFYPLNKESFETSFASCHGVITAAGFGTTTEALFLGKSLLVIPQKHQYEQACNALALKQMGVRVLKSLKDKNVEKIRLWTEVAQAISVEYADQTEELINEMLYVFHNANDAYTDYLTREQFLQKPGELA